MLSLHGRGGGGSYASGLRGVLDMGGAVELFYICLPEGWNREEYVADCESKGTISIRNETGIQHNVRYPIGTLYRMRIPASFHEAGSIVVCVKEPRTDTYFIVAAYDNPNVATREDENAYNFRGDGNGTGVNVEYNRRGRAVISAVGEGAELRLTASGEASMANIEAEGDLNIASGRATLYVEGSLAIQHGSTSNITLHTNDDEEAIISIVNNDSNIIINGTTKCVEISNGDIKITLKDGKIMLGDGEENPVRAQVVKDIITELTNILNGGLLSPMGPVTLNPAATNSLTQIKTDLNRLASENVVID